jgi:hypothetical protein
MPATLWTKLNPRWLVKQLAMAALFFGFGVWGFVDAKWVYPERGVKYAEYTRFKYLETIKREAAQGTVGDPSVKDPQAEYERLHKDRENLKDPIIRARHDWLEALGVVGRLTPEHTTIVSADSDHAALEKKYTSTTGVADIPKRLESYDVPVQWVICVVGVAIGTIMAGFAMIVGRRRYGYDPASKELTLPDGATLALDQCEDFDRRKWDKFLMFVKVKAGHPTLSGQELKLDLLRYQPLESWVVEMEYALFPDRQKPQDPPADGIVAPGGMSDPSSLSPSQPGSGAIGS